MGLPNKIIAVQAYVGVNRRFFGEIDEVELADLEEDTEKVDSSPIGDFNMGKGIKQPVIKLKLKGLYNAFMAEFGNPVLGAQVLTLMASIQEADGSTKTIEVNAAGNTRKLPGAKLKSRTIPDETAELECIKYQFIEGGTERVNIDYLNTIFVVDGVDRFAAFNGIGAL